MDEPKGARTRAQEWMEIGTGRDRPIDPRIMSVLSHASCGKLSAGHQNTAGLW